MAMRSQFELCGLKVLKLNDSLDKDVKKLIINKWINIGQT